MKAYKLEVCVIDMDGLGPDGIKAELENTRFANDCINPQVMGIVEADIGEWHDGHPLNLIKEQKAEFERLFP